MAGIVLNVSYQATRNLELGKERLYFEARFGGVARQVSVPVDAVLCIYSRETGQGVVLTDQLGAAFGEISAQSPEPPPRGNSQAAPDQVSSSSSRRHKQWMASRWIS